MRRSHMLAALAVIIGGCGPTLEEQQIGHLRHLMGDVRLGPDGQRDVRIPVLPGETALLATVQGTSPNGAHVREFLTPEGVQVFDANAEASSPRSKTNAGFVGAAASLGWPVLADDPQLSQGNWPLAVGVAQADGRYVRDTARVDVLLKSDDDATSGTLRVAIVYAGDVAQDDAFIEAIRLAVETWRELYGAFGIALDVEEHEYPVGELQAPGTGSEQHYIAIAKQTGIGVTNVVIAPRIMGLSDVYGVAGDIPAPLVATPRTAVVISAEDARGPDGRMSETELRILGETLAHETGHTLGLFHPVETTYDLWDALEDTEECEGERACINRLGENMMFPFPVCGFFTCTPQTMVSEAQATIAHGYVGVD
ncbi:MAG: hypothetical protein ACI8PZ_002944 [Myxococcota bacterium]